ncbi:hypothetical protein [Streptomyces sp. NPDC017941]|uniref:hypothetical protein n=1 Tax=Streptomyces sp. NPDC017941 TaxID=3365018 RepID=UPI0037AFD49E
MSESGRQAAGFAGAPSDTAASLDRSLRPTEYPARSPLATRDAVSLLAAAESEPPSRPPEPF